MVRLQRKADDSKGPDVPPEGWKNGGREGPEKGGRKRPLHMDEMTMFVEFLFGG